MGEMIYLMASDHQRGFPFALSSTGPPGEASFLMRRAEPISALLFCSETAYHFDTYERREETYDNPRELHQRGSAKALAHYHHWHLSGYGNEAG